MQKKIIALAVAGLMSGAAFAQSNVTISGLVKMGFEQYKLQNVGAANAFSTENRISDQSSRIIFSGTEDLGGGMKAMFSIDNRFAPDAGAGTWAGGNTWLAVKKDGIGLVGLGRADVHYNENGGLESNRAGSLQASATAGIMSQNNGNAIAVTSRANNLIWFDSDNFGGVTFRLGGSTGHGAEGSGLRAAGLANPGDGSAVTSALRYANGPVAVGASYWRFKAEGAGGVGDQRSTRLYGGYTMGPVKFGLVYDNNKLNQGAVGALTNTKRTAWMIPVTYTMGNSQFYFTYAKAGQLKGSGTVAGANDTAAKQYTLGYDYALSKRTSAGVFYTKLDNKSNGTYDLFGLAANGATATGAGMDASQLYMGLAHSF